MKRILQSLLLLAAAAALLAPSRLLADTEVVDGIEWSYTISDGKATVTKANPASGDLVIPTTLGGCLVTSIRYYAFDRCSDLTSVMIPDSVTSIGFRAFWYCSSLTSVTIPDSVTSIGKEAFYGCSGLESVVVPARFSALFDSRLFHPQVQLLSAAIRESEPMVMDIDYIVHCCFFTETPQCVNVRALAFEDGERGFAKVVRPETFIEGTDANVGDSIAANVVHRLSWKVSSDWATDLSKVKFEVLAMKPGEPLLPDMHFVTIPAAEGHPKTIVSVNDMSEGADELTRDPDAFGGIYRDFWPTYTFESYFERFYCVMSHDSVLNALLWLYASGEPDLSLLDGCLTHNGRELVFHSAFSFSCDNPTNTNGGQDVLWSTSREAIQYVFEKMGYRLLCDEELEWVNETLRLGLTPDNYRQYAVKTVEE